MDHTTLVSVEIFVIAIVALLGFFITKTRNLGGFGPHTTSALLILVTIFIAAILFMECKLDPQFFSNLAFAIIGFAGGLFTQKHSEKTGIENSDVTTPKGNG